jgi:CO dehydrogenase/acetyl-CoA synthase alpha subunit
MEVLTGDVEPVSFEEPEEETQAFEKEAEEIAAVGLDPKWQIIHDYMSERIQFYQNDLAGLDLTNMDLAKVGERFLVCSLVSMELHALQAKVKITTEAVDEARERSESA